MSDLQEFVGNCYQSFTDTLRRFDKSGLDGILDVLLRLRIIDGMELGEHHGFDVADTVPIFQTAGFALTVHRRFQLGLNHLLVFEKPAPHYEKT